MSRLSKLKGKSNGKTEVKAEPSQTAPKASTESPKQSTTRVSRLARGRKKEPVRKDPVPSEKQIEKELNKLEKADEKTYPKTPPENVETEQVPRKSRLASLGITKEEPPRPVPMDEEVEQFQKDLDTIEKMAYAQAPELREGISSVMQRIQTREHLKEYLYDNPAEMRKALIGFRAQFTKRHKATSERATKAARKKSDTADFLKDAGLG